jgi:hypothetical protein
MNKKLKGKLIIIYRILRKFQNSFSRFLFTILLGKIQLKELLSFNFFTIYYI